MAKISLTRLTEDDREQFILDNQLAFKYGAMEEFGERDNHFEEDGEIISRKTIENSIDNGVAYRIREDGKIVGGMVLTINEETQHNHPDPHDPETGEENNYEGEDFNGMFRFEKQMPCFEKELRNN